jgi:hypothetical protein
MCSQWQQVAHSFMYAQVMYEFGWDVDWFDQSVECL